MKPLTNAERTALMEQFEINHGTINGRPACIVGRLLDFPRVVALDNSVNVEWSWHGLLSLMSRGFYNVKHRNRE